MQDFSLKMLITRDEIKTKVKEIARTISDDYRGQDVLAVGVLRGAVIFMADLIRELDINVEIDFMAVSSYGASTTTSGVVRMVKDLDTSIEGRHVLIVEDIIDTGLTLNYLFENLQNRQPASLQVVTLLDKPERRRVEFVPHYRGFVIPDQFVAGYGLDYNGKYRNLPDICILEEINK